VLTAKRPDVCADFFRKQTTSDADQNDRFRRALASAFTTTRAEQGREQRPSGPQNDSSQAGRGPKSAERKHEMA